MFRKIIEAEKPPGRWCCGVALLSCRQNAVIIEDWGTVRCERMRGFAHLFAYRLLRFDPGFRVSLSKMVNIEQVRAAKLSNQMRPNETAI